MIRATVYAQATPIPDGTMVVDGEVVTAYKANLTARGIVEGATRSECWHRARAITPAPVMRWMQ